jgi:hypothetical protein
LVTLPRESAAEYCDDWIVFSHPEPHETDGVLYSIENNVSGEVLNQTDDATIRLESDAASKKTTYWRLIPSAGNGELFHVINAQSGAYLGQMESGSFTSNHSVGMSAAYAPEDTDRYLWKFGNEAVRVYSIHNIDELRDEFAKKVIQFLISQCNHGLFTVDPNDGYKRAAWFDKDDLKLMVRKDKLFKKFPEERLGTKKSSYYRIDRQGFANKKSNKGQTERYIKIQGQVDKYSVFSVLLHTKVEIKLDDHTLQGAMRTSLSKQKSVWIYRNGSVHTEE